MVVVVVVVAAAAVVDVVVVVVVAVVNKDPVSGIGVVAGSEEHGWTDLVPSTREVDELLA